jgi:hypothetical protein
MTYTAREVDDALETFVTKEYPEDEVSFDEAVSEEYEGSITINDEQIPVEWVEVLPGYGGGGEHTYAVFTLGGQTFKKEGHYFSHYGTDWDGPLYEVEEVEVLRKEWKRV